MESRAMRNRLQFSFWGMRLNAEGVIAIAAAPVIVLAVLTGGVQVLKSKTLWTSQTIFSHASPCFQWGRALFP
jgi:hypothetical protein